MIFAASGFLDIIISTCLNKFCVYFQVCYQIYINEITRLWLRAMYIATAVYLLLWKEA